MQSQLLQQSQHHKKHTWQIVFKLRLTRELRDLSNLFWRNVIDRLSSLNSFSKSSPTLASLTTSPPALAAFNLAEKSIKWKSNATYMKSRNLRRFKTFHSWKIALILSQNFPWIFYANIASCLYFPAHFWVPKLRKKSQKHYLKLMLKNYQFYLAIRCAHKCTVLCTTLFKM